jgi:two-component sensor histidine kinase
MNVISARPITILYVDDDPDLARLIERVLTRRGYNVESAANSEEGLARLRQGGIDVVALDHLLPTGTGLDFLNELNRQPSPPPVVYVTGAAETVVAVAALKAGAADYVPKAASDDFLELLGSAIDQAVEKARLEHERDRAEREVRESRDRAEVLLHEVNHRVANSLALVAALVRLQADSVDDSSVKEALAETQARIGAIAGVHRRLYNSDDVRSVDIAGYLGSLLNELGNTMKAAGNPLTVLFTAEPLSVPTDKAVSIGVLVTELVTNAFKYAYPNGEGGEVRVSFRRMPSAKVLLSVEDDGIGWNGTGTPKGTGIGSRIVTAMARNLGSNVEYAGAAGCKVKLELEI